MEPKKQCRPHQDPKTWDSVFKNVPETFTGLWLSSASFGLRSFALLGLLGFSLIVAHTLSFRSLKTDSLSSVLCRDNGLRGIGFGVNVLGYA